MKISLSGIRGIVGQDLTPEFILNYAMAFASTIKSKGLVGIAMDGRKSGDMLKYAIIAGLVSCGVDVLDLGISTTPTLLFSIRNKNLDGGVMITASHNPEEYNGIKWASKEGRFLNSKEWSDVNKIYNKKNYRLKDFNHTGEVVPYFNANDDHINNVLKLVDVDKIRSKSFRVAYDPVNSSGSLITLQLLKLLGCELYSINGNTKNRFARNPEPTPDNIKGLEELVLKESCDIGFALDPDGDRLSIVSDKAIAIGEEYTLLLVADQYLKANKSDIVVNISTSRMVDDLSAKYGVNVIRTKVGEINVIDKMLKHNYSIGGEGNGGVIIPEINLCRDSLVAMVMVLSSMVHNNSNVSELIKRFNKYYFIKDKIEVDIDFALLYKKLEQIYSRSSIFILDGIKVEQEDYWIQIRESNTEPIIRVFVEAKSKGLAREQIDKIKNLCKGF